MDTVYSGDLPRRNLSSISKTLGYETAMSVNTTRRYSLGDNTHVNKTAMATVAIDYQAVLNGDRDLTKRRQGKAFGVICQQQHRLPWIFSTKVTRRFKRQP